jgi:hypothetical protein
MSNDRPRPFPEVFVLPTSSFPLYYIAETREIASYHLVLALASAEGEFSSTTSENENP